MDNFNIDHDRKKRNGFPEVIFGLNKSIKDLISIIEEYQKRKRNACVSKLQPEKAEVLQSHFLGSFYDTDSGIFLLQEIPEGSEDHQVGILSAGSSDIHVVNEAYYTLQYLGASATRICDVGVAGIHRLMDRLEDLKSLKVIIVVAGFEGALPSVVGGLVRQPIIAVPANVGYGVASGGHAALNAMLASCANGITVMNIDNGFGAAMAAYRILNTFNEQ